MSKLILAIDQGTTGSTALLIDEALKVRGRANQEFRQIYPRPGLVEHDPRDILASVQTAVVAAIQTAGVSARDIAAIGITNQRETTVLWDRRTLEPVMNAIVWQDRRTEPRCRQLNERGHEERFRQATGLVLDPYFSGTKLAWMLDELEGVRARAEAGALAFGTIDSFLVSHLTGGAQHVTDVSNASRTLMFDIHALRWDPELLKILRVPREVLPEVRGSSEVYGETRGLGWLPDGIPIAGIAGDQQSALFGQLCLKPGMAKCTYGTGAFLMLNTGPMPVPSHNGLLTTVGWKIGGETTYALEGSAFIAGAAVQWLRDGLGIIKKASEIEGLARQVPDAGGVTFVPALAGLGAPHWRPEARGVLAGLSRGTTAAHIARATLEGVALQIRDLAAAMAQDLGREMIEMRVDGGAAANDLLMQMQADYSRVRLVRPVLLETTALGAALLAGLAVGIWPGTDALAHAWAAERTFTPQLDGELVRAKLAEWSNAVAKA